MTYLTIALILMLCAFVQTVAGFAFSLMAIPLLLLCDLTLPQAVVTSMMGSTVQRLLMVAKYRHQVDWPPLFRMYPWAVLGIFIGICLLRQIAGLDINIVRQLFGGVILAVVSLQAFTRVKPREHVPAWCGWIAAFFSGILNGFANIGGPPMVFWILAHGWGRDQLRATMPCFTVMMVPIQTIFLFLSFGSAILCGFGLGVASAPAIILAVFLGNKASSRLSVPKLRLAIMLLLVATGLYYIIAPFCK